MLLVSLLMLCAVSDATTAGQTSHESAVYVGSGRVKRLVQFIGNQATPRYPCIRPDGTSRRCRPVRECLKENLKSGIINFMGQLCVMNGTSVGACCLEEEKEVEGIAGLAGSLPATAEQEEEDNVVLKIDRAENRGCGVSTRPHVRLPGSRPADPREWPWMASVTPDGFVQYCGGVLITDEHVLTAAHCTRRWEPEELFVRLGEYDMNRSNDSRAYNFKVVEKRQHEDFDITTYRHDVAILKLHRKAVFNTYIWPICLPPPGLKLTDEIAVITGWGTQHFGGPISNVLMEVSVPVWDHQVCVDSFTDTVFEENLCAGGREGGRDACQGDSGGPLMYQMGSGRWTVIGIVSWGVRCGEANHPGIYASVDNYLPWIRNNVNF